MRRLLFMLLIALAAAGCATPTERQDSAPPQEPVVTEPQAVVIALPPEHAETLNWLPDVTFLTTADPLGAVLAGQADIAVTSHAPEEKLSSFLFLAQEQVLMQGYLDEPRALTSAQARELLLQLGPPLEAGAGKLAKGRLNELAPGWVPIPVDGVVPTPHTIADGSYPLANRVLVAYRPVLSAPALEIVALLESRAARYPDQIRVTVAGDFMLARGVARAMRENGTLYPIAKVQEHLRSADIAFANLESPIGVKGQPLPGKGIWFRAPVESVELLKAAGLDGLVIANNHILDYDTENFLETLELLEQAGLPYVGGGRNITEARAPLVLESQGIKVAFLGYSEFADLFFSWDYPRSFSATETTPGVARIDTEWLAEDIQAASALADIVAVTFHWGDEFVNHPNAYQQELARLAIDLGADLVLGYHPHAIQGFELYQGGFIAYSTGNFIMDWQETTLAQESMLLDFFVTRDGVRSVTVHPVWIEREQPYKLSGDEAERLREKMRLISGWK